VGQKAIRHQPLQLGREAKKCYYNQQKSSPPSTQEGSHLVHLALGGHGGHGFTDSNSPDKWRGGSHHQRSKQKWVTIKTTTGQKLEEGSNQNMLMQRMEWPAALPSTKEGSHLLVYAMQPLLVNDGGCCLRVLNSNSNLQVLKSRNCVLPLSVNFG
jgi:hypothetical protein